MLPEAAVVEQGGDINGREEEEVNSGEMQQRSASAAFMGLQVDGENEMETDDRKSGATRSQKAKGVSST